MWFPVVRTTLRRFTLGKHAGILHHGFTHQMTEVTALSNLPVVIRSRKFSSEASPVSRPLLDKAQAANLQLHQRRNFVPSPKSVVTGIHENISALHSKKRLGRRRDMPGTNGLKVVQGFTTAEEYDLEALHGGLIKQDLYIVTKLTSSHVDEDKTAELEKRLDQPDVLYAVAKYQVENEPREIFFFREGSTVMWNVRDEEVTNILAFVKPFEHNSYDELLVMSEKESMTYKYAECNRTKILRGSVVMPKDQTNITLEKYAISDAISSSVKLGVWEASLECYISSIEFVTDDLKMGNKIRMSREEVLRKHGELFALRHLINLSSDLLDTPDFYWEHDDLENVYQGAVSYFSIGRRTRVMNEKLNHCVELVELISSHLNDKHHIRLEWMIIVLIMVEVVFEILHFSERIINRRTEDEFIVEASQQQ